MSIILMISSGLFSRRCNPIVPNPLDTYIYFSLNEYEYGYCRKHAFGDISKIKYKKSKKWNLENRRWRIGNNKYDLRGNKKAVVSRLQFASKPLLY